MIEQQGRCFRISVRIIRYNLYIFRGLGIPFRDRIRHDGHRHRSSRLGRTHHCLPNGIPSFKRHKRCTRRERDARLC